MHPHTVETLHDGSSSVSRLEQLLRDALSYRIQNIPDPPVREQESQLEPARLGILFSGGLDCTALACLSHDIIASNQPVDLLNVAFENPRVHKSAYAREGELKDVYELCPDRITGRASYDELKEVCPGRDWRFVAINVPYSETMATRQKIITLMHPHNTEMDLSISYALYFAARGVGTLTHREQPNRHYTSSARVLLSGLGADELFAGYTRHATAFKRNGLLGLLDELDLDIQRLGKRNLGRDDRIISDSSREVRFPFLDEKLLAWALSVPVHEKCDFEQQLEAGTACDGLSIEPGKKVLRCLARKLGMKNVAREKKRAVSLLAMLRFDMS